MIGRNRQRGATLIVGLVMLLVLTLLVVSAIRSSNVNLRIVGNMQRQDEVSNAAQQVVEQVISSNFTVSPAASSVTVDINKDGTGDYTVNVPAPACLGSIPLTNNTPNLPPECISSGVARNTGMMTASGVASTAQSWCYAQQWDVQATTTDAGTGATATVHQGVSLNVPAGTGC